MQIDETCIETECLPLHYPNITYRVGNGRDKTADISDTEQFKWNGREGTKGFLQDIRPIRQWCIVDDYRSRGAGNKVHEIWRIYCSMRRFDERNGPIQKPQILTIDMDRGFEEYISIAQQNWDLIFVVLPDHGKSNSEIKAHFTKAVQTHKISGDNGSLVQFILQRNAFNKDAVFHAFEDSLAKCGNILFKLTPHLPPNSPYYLNKAGGKDLSKIWTIGLDVSSKKGDKPST
eukprot:268927_1